MTRQFAAWGRFVCFVVGVSTSASWVWAQGVPTPGPGGFAPPTGEGSAVVPMLILIVVLLAVFVLAVGVMDLRRKRQAQAVAIEGQISDALMREPRLAGAVLIALAHVPLSARSAPTVEIRGEVEYPELSETAVRIVREELLRHHPEGRVEDRIFVAPPVPTARR
jgi:hypothetical protein